jgi:hypothetical protein
VHGADGRVSSIREVGGRRGIWGRDGESQLRNFVETPRVGINEMDPLLCGSAVISHNAVRKTDEQRTARRTSPMKHELSLVAIDLAKKVFHLVGADTTGTILWRGVFQLCTLVVPPFMIWSV